MRRAVLQMLSLTLFVAIAFASSSRAASGNEPNAALVAQAQARYEALIASPPPSGAIAPDRLILVDYSLPANQPRMYLMKRVANVWSSVSTLYVAHGKGSNVDGGYLTPRVFSDKPGGNASTLGAFRVSDAQRQVACTTVGRCIRIDGLEPQNSNAYSRAVVIHSNETRTGYQPQSPHGKYFAPSKGLFGRSDGCLVVADEDLDGMIAFATPGVLIYIGLSKS